MLSIGVIIEALKTAVGFFQKKEQSNAEQSHEQNQITLEETKQGLGWRQGLGWVLVAVVAWNYVAIPVLAALGVFLPPVPLDEVWKVVIILIG